MCSLSFIIASGDRVFYISMYVMEMIRRINMMKTVFIIHFGKIATVSILSYV